MPIRIKKLDSATACVATGETFRAQPSASAWAANPPTATATPMAAEAPTPTRTMDPRPNASTAAGTAGTRAHTAMARSGDGLLSVFSAIPNHYEVHPADGSHDQADGKEHAMKPCEPVHEEPDPAPHA